VNFSYGTGQIPWSICHANEKTIATITKP